jgi:TolA-binding protein
MTRQPVPALPTPPVPAPQPQQVPAAPPDPNRVTDSRIIQYLPLTDAERYSFEIQHRQARDFYQSRRYRDAMMKFAEMSASYPMDYLSPYWAGMCALSLNDGDTAARWFGFSLQKNPAYQPARDELSRMGRL